MMNELEKQLLCDTIGEVVPRLAVRSRTRMDTGLWWRRSRVWVCVTDDELVVLAVARRRYVARVPLSACAASYYCHTTGELVVAPVEDLKVSRLRVTPREALELLRVMGIPQWESE